MSLVMDHNFDGVALIGKAFLGDAVYSLGLGAPVYAASHYGAGIKFPAGTQAFISEAFAGTTGPRVFSRILKISAAPAAAVQIWHARTASAKLAGAQIMPTGQLRIQSGDGSVNTTSAASVSIGSEFRLVLTVNGTTFTAAIYPDLVATTPTQTITCTLPAAGTMTNTREGATDAAASVDITLAWPQDDSAADPGLRKYVYLTADLTTGIVPKTVNAVVHTENLPAAGGTLTYTVDFGDGTVIGPQASPNFSHTFTVPGDAPMIPKVDES